MLQIPLLPRECRKLHSTFSSIIKNLEKRKYQVEIINPDDVKNMVIIGFNGIQVLSIYYNELENRIVKNVLAN